MPDDQTVRLTTMLWSEVVARANAAEGEPIAPKLPAYRFTGKVFYQRDDPYTDD